jgi:hypothetical protein
MRRRYVGALMIVVSLLVASCGESTGSTARPRAGTSSSRAPTAEQHLADQMLSLGDLPEGWSADRHDRVPGADPCSLSLTSDASAGVQHEARYTGSAGGLPAVGEVLISFPTVAAARVFFVDDTSGSSCMAESALPPGATSEPYPSSLSDAPVYSFLTATDEGLASRLSETTTTAGGDSTTIGIGRLIARRGRIIALVYLAEPDEADWSLFVRLANNAVDKITDRETTAQYETAGELCEAGLPLTPGATKVSYAGVTTYGTILGNPLSFGIPDDESTRAFLAVCSYAGNDRPLIRVYIDAAGHRYQPQTSF